MTREQHCYCWCYANNHGGFRWRHNHTQQTCHVCAHRNQPKEQHSGGVVDTESWLRPWILYHNLGFKSWSAWWLRLHGLWGGLCRPDIDLLHWELNSAWTHLWLLEAQQERSGDRAVLLDYIWSWFWILWWWKMEESKKEPFLGGMECYLQDAWFSLLWMDGLIQTVVKFVGLTWKLVMLNVIAIDCCNLSSAIWRIITHKVNSCRSVHWSHNNIEPFN